MTANTRPGNDNMAGRSTGDAAVRGALLVGVAVIIGALLLWRGHDNNDNTAQSTIGSTTTTTAKRASGATGSGVTAGAGTVSGVTAGTGKTGPTGTTGTTGTTATGAATGASGTTGLLHKAAEVKVIVANGSGTTSGAGQVTAKLQPKGYAMLAAADAATATVAASRVYYRDGYAEDAKQVARDIGVAEPVEGVLERMPADLQLKTPASTATAKTANVVVIIGLDKKIPQA
ncbi:MAG: hypothetical protein F2754_03990 [Actinobacteria bacterium]|uniref:Unannotated protein n=1 Tax=freshwater metagenome TaxID=449393 RepID=A0A6J6UK63_9ZZZZ|nr:hypothetical protein [Actinomycetota bacterium]MSX86526.1 hypothetical protein [Actinomycetota bacterium]MSY72574.1 hypothetical protein [Actinomycetota bacterium]